MIAKNDEVCYTDFDFGFFSGGFTMDKKELLTEAQKRHNMNAAAIVEYIETFSDSFSFVETNKFLTYSDSSDEMTDAVITGFFSSTPARFTLVFIAFSPPRVTYSSISVLKKTGPSLQIRLLCTCE